MGFIYKITNTMNGKSYIGQTIQKPEKRINNHFYPGGSGCAALHNAIQKYGRDAFTVEILHEVLDIFLDDLEIAEIKRYNTLVPNGYNLDSGGNANKVVSDETRQKMSEARKGCKRNPCSPETRKKISDAHKGKTISLEARKKMSEAGKKRKPASLKTRQKMSEALKGRTHTPEARKKMSEIKAHPDRPKAFEFLNTLPAHMSLAERRKALQNNFPKQPKANIYQWVKQWIKASST